MNILVTGATGLVGATLSAQLVAHGADVRILRRSSSRLDLLGPAADAVDHATGDLRDIYSLYEAMEGVDQVYHVAGALGVGNGARGDTLYRINADGTANVVDAALARGVRRLVYTSSIATLRPAGEPSTPVDERFTPAPALRSPYARSKYRGELEVQRGVAEGLDAVIVNPALIFGKGRAGENTRRIVDLVRGGWVRAAPPGGTNVVDVEDVAEGHRRAMAHGTTGERYLLGGENLSWRAILDILADAFDVQRPRGTVPSWVLHVGGTLAEAWATVTRTRPLFTRSTAHSMSRSVQYSNARAVEELGCSFRPFTDTADRLARALACSGD